MNQIISLNATTATKINVIAYQINARPADVIGKALLIEQLKIKLRSGKIVKFVYMKKDGSLRIAHGTTNSDFIQDKLRGWGESRESFHNEICGKTKVRAK